MNIMNMISVQFITISIVQGFLFKIVYLSLQVLDLLVFLHLKLLRVDLISETFQLTHNHSHVTTIRIQKVLLRVCANLLNQVVNVGYLIIDLCEMIYDFLGRNQLCKSFF